MLSPFECFLCAKPSAAIGVKRWKEGQEDTALDLSELTAVEETGMRDQPPWLDFFLATQEIF